MIEWFKKLFKKEKVEHKKPEVTKETIKKTERTAPAPPPSKVVKENNKQVGVTSSREDELKGMKKDQLLDYAKKHGIKANASLKKQQIIDKILNS